MSEGIVDGSARDAAWYALHSADTDAARLARIAEVYPEFAPQIAVHPNAYPELVAWAASYGPSAPAAPDSNPPAAAGSVVAASGIPGQPGNAAQPGYPSAAHPVLARPPRNTGLWFFAFLFVAAGPIAASMIALNLPLSLDGTFPAYAFLHAVGPLAMLIPILVSAPAGGKPLAGALLAVLAAVAGVLGVGFSAQLGLLGGIPIIALFLAWALCRPLVGWGYAGLLVLVPLEIVVGLFGIFIMFQLAYTGLGIQTALFIYALVLNFVSPLLVALLATAWSNASERRRAVATVPAQGARG